LGRNDRDPANLDFQPYAVYMMVPQQLPKKPTRFANTNAFLAKRAREACPRPLVSVR
jgi:hypothetical protein